MLGGRLHQQHPAVGPKRRRVTAIYNRGFVRPCGRGSNKTRGDTVRVRSFVLSPCAARTSRGVVVVVVVASTDGIGVLFLQMRC